MPTTTIIASDIDVVFMLSNSASTATGESIAAHASSLTVQTMRLRIGTAIKPTTTASATAA